MGDAVILPSRGVTETANGAGSPFTEERLAATLRDLSEAHGNVPGGRVAVIAMGKLGGREMTAASDLDLIMVYDYPPARETSVGLKPLPHRVLKFDSEGRRVR